MTTAPTVTIVVNTYNQARFLPDSVASCLAQTTPAAEIIVVDDGSTEDDPVIPLREFPGVKLVRQANRGLSGARNTGLAQATSEFITFLDADDRLTPEALSAGLTALRDHPQAGLAYGAHCAIDGQGQRISGLRFYRPGSDATLDLLAHGNFIGMHATVLYRRAALGGVGGFDESLRACEDYDVYMRLSGVTAFAAHDTLVAEYRKHGEQMSSNHQMMKRLATEVIDRQLARRDDEASRRAAARGRRYIDRLYTLAAFRSSGLRLARGRAQPGDLAQAVKAFAAFPGAATRVLLEKVSGHARNDVTVRLR